jgi:hypothetical protein
MYPVLVLTLAVPRAARGAGVPAKRGRSVLEEQQDVDIASLGCAQVPYRPCCLSRAPKTPVLDFASEGCRYYTIAKLSLRNQPITHTHRRYDVDNKRAERISWKSISRGELRARNPCSLHSISWQRSGTPGVPKTRPVSAG